MADIDLKTETPDTSLPTTGFLFGADSQVAASPSVFTVQSVATTLLGSTTLTGATVTTSSPVIDAAQTWNAGGVTFTGLKFNATDTASAAASLLMDLQVGGVSRFYVGKTGRANVFDLNCWDGDLLIYRAGVNNGRWGLNQLSISTQLALSTQGNTSNPDSFLRRRAAANLQFGAADAAAPVAQTLSVQSVVAGTTNTAGANLTITGSQGTGTGAGGSIIFQVAPAGSSGTAQNALATALTIADTGATTFTGTINATTVALGASGVIRLANINNGSNTRTFWTFEASTDAATFAGGMTSPLMRFSGATSSFPALKRSSTTLQVRLADDTANAALESASLKTDAPTGGTAATWKLGTVATVTPTLQNRTIEVDIGGTIYYISAKTTND
jgi:hypothetical protein